VTWFPSTRAHLLVCMQFLSVFLSNFVRAYRVL
jgi:hypothetical protein